MLLLGRDGARGVGASWGQRGVSFFMGGRGVVKGKGGECGGCGVGLFSCKGGGGLTVGGGVGGMGWRSFFREQEVWSGGLWGVLLFMSFLF